MSYEIKWGNWKNFLVVISRNYPLQVPPDSLQWTGLCGNAKQLNVGQGPCVNNSIPILFSEGEVGKKSWYFVSKIVLTYC